MTSEYYKKHCETCLLKIQRTAFQRTHILDLIFAIFQTEETGKFYFTLRRYCCVFHLISVMLTELAGAVHLLGLGLTNADNWTRSLAVKKSKTGEPWKWTMGGRWRFVFQSSCDAGISSAKQVMGRKSLSVKNGLDWWAGLALLLLNRCRLDWRDCCSKRRSSQCWELFI